MTVIMGLLVLATGKPRFLTPSTLNLKLTFMFFHFACRRDTVLHNTSSAHDRLLPRCAYNRRGDCFGTDCPCDLDICDFGCGEA